MFKSKLIAFASFGLLGCATLRNENVGQDVGRDGVLFASETNPLIISSTLVNPLSSQYFGYLDFTIENKSDKWVVMDNIKVEFENELQTLYCRFIRGNEFADWQSATLKVLEIREFNTGQTAAVVAALGFAVGSLSDNKTISAAGNITAASSLGYYAGTKIQNRVDSIEQTTRIDDNNLLADSILVLPGLFSKCWLLVNSREHDRIGFINKMKISYEIEGNKYTVEIKIRDKYPSFSDKWQTKPQSSGGFSTPVVSEKRR